MASVGLPTAWWLKAAGLLPWQLVPPEWAFQKVPMGLKCAVWPGLRSHRAALCLCSVDGSSHRPAQNNWEEKWTFPPKGRGACVCRGKGIGGSYLRNN